MLWKSIVSKSLSEKRKKKNSGSDAGFAQWYIGVTIHKGSNFILIVVARAISNFSKNHTFLICRF